MRIEIIPCLRDNYSYLIVDEINNNACVVDPSEAEPIINFIEKNNINLRYILNFYLIAFFRIDLFILFTTPGPS